MIITDGGLVWKHLHGGHGPRAEEFTEFAWDGDERLRRIVQRPNQDEPFMVTYHVVGLAQIYRTPDEAMQAMRDNP